MVSSAIIPFFLLFNTAAAEQQTPLKKMAATAWIPTME
jgi:hypothetical protein